jgi:GNAT superfamily N-acetyltransferase
MTLEWRQRTLVHPDYQPGLDLVVVAPNGELAAFCIGWFHTSGPGGKPSGQIEPMGVHPIYRQLGLSKLLQNELFRRMQAWGINCWS